MYAHTAQRTPPTNQLFPGPSARSAGPANQPPGPARVLPGSPTGQKFLRSAYSTRRTSKWVEMGYFTPLQAPRSIFSPLSILKLRHEGHSGLLDALGCQGKEPLRPLRRVADRYASARSAGPINQHLEAWSAQSGQRQHPEVIIGATDCEMSCSTALVHQAHGCSHVM